MQTAEHIQPKSIVECCVNISTVGQQLNVQPITNALTPICTYFL